ncbi:hypothetical protein [Pseudoalteromonas luteoviolacea]|uniref:Uncharacterized protein n=1 Tax=Pseudoalteromonas luteoviolacea S4060-1 TaxID=1365257 RepID=A0A162BLP0_9GAMM|nr:hypothetical protein [Pseudoalteromonas luteoviolacea]KZN63934.1 hypothetical protein N478_23590 [Pseudoalteromonas luteoviolacea S4060-1]
MKLQLKKKNFKQLTQNSVSIEREKTPQIAGGRLYLTDINCDITGRDCPATLTCRACGSRRC